MTMLPPIQCTSNATAVQKNSLAIIALVWSISTFLLLLFYFCKTTITLALSNCDQIPPSPNSPIRIFQSHKMNSLSSAWGTRMKVHLTQINIICENAPKERRRRKLESAGEKYLRVQEKNTSLHAQDLSSLKIPRGERVDSERRWRSTKGRGVFNQAKFERWEPWARRGVAMEAQRNTESRAELKERSFRRSSQAGEQ